MIEKKNFYINGKWVSPAKPNDFEVINPSTEEAFAIISLGSAEDADKAINCLLYTSPSPRDGLLYRMPSSA